MPKYLVTLPITGILCVEVEADSEDAAIDAAFEQDVTRDDIEEWGMHKAVCTGNVFHGMLNDADAREIA